MSYFPHGCTLFFSCYIISNVFAKICWWLFYIFLIILLQSGVSQCRPYLLEIHVKTLILQLESVPHLCCDGNAYNKLPLKVSAMFLWARIWKLMLRLCIITSIFLDTFLLYRFLIHIAKYFKRVSKRREIIFNMSKTLWPEQCRTIQRIFGRKRQRAATE